ncbi:hypothetical protein L596_024692 [Steinernema carpocapsae]|uniref:Uncharacterized protein n=1 Tax=Steinernema carpocapsae TaxID=34508 RepID=A0A4U5M5L6_STECR|nr:hypothetical protein L596_024692 [Steinernema carpocapsae]
MSSATPSEVQDKATPNLQNQDVYRSNLKKEEQRKRERRLTSFEPLHRGQIKNGRMMLVTTRDLCVPSAPLD